MKCKLDCAGVMIFTPESEVEAYALECWRSECCKMIGEDDHPLIDVDCDYDSLPS